MLPELFNQQELIISGTIIILTILLLGFFVFGNQGKISRKTPRGFPIIRNVFDLIPENFLSAVEKHCNELGDLFELYAFSKKYVILSNLQHITEILSKRPKVFRRSRLFIKNAEFLSLESG